jgi:hypothetical protein
MKRRLLSIFVALAMLATTSLSASASGAADLNTICEEVKDHVTETAPIPKMPLGAPISDHECDYD